RSPMSARQIAQPQISNSNAHQPLHFVADGVKHSPDLLIESLVEHDSQARRTDRMESRNLRALSVEHDAAKKFCSQRLVPLSIQGDLVFLFDPVARMSQALREVAVIC